MIDEVIDTLRYEPDSAQDLAAYADATARMLVLAGPGTGKTQVCAMRLAYLVSSGLRPSQILVLSFSRSAVRTLVKRIDTVAKLQGDQLEHLRYLSVRTFDSWAFRLLRLFGEQPGQLMRAGYEANIDSVARMMSDDRSEEVRELLGGIRHIIIDESQDLGSSRLAMVHALLALLAPPGHAGAGFTILGDDAQAIYGFAARDGVSNPAPASSCMQGVRERYQDEVRDIVLTRNYRASPKLGAQVANLRRLFVDDLSGASRLSVMKAFVAGLPAETVKRLDDSWLQTLPTGSVAILTRTNGEALRVATQLAGTQMGAPAVPVSLQLSGFMPPVPPWIATILGPLKSDSVTRTQFGRIHAYAVSKLGEEGTRSISLPDESVAWLRLAYVCGLAQDAGAIPVEDLRNRMTWPDAFPDDQLPDESLVQICTIHQSKGKEYDSVFLLSQPEQGGDEEPGVDAVNEIDGALDADDCNEVNVVDREGGTGSDSDAGDSTAPVDLDEEARVLFVGVTRAAHHIGTIPREAINQPFNATPFGQGRRRRLMCWRNGWMNIETGISGDIDPLGFVDSLLHGGSDKVAAVQNKLVWEAAQLRGRKVILHKVVQDSGTGTVHVVYLIRLQEPEGQGMLIGRMTGQLTKDLYSKLKSKYPYPSIIMNLRIGSVHTVTSALELPLSIHEPYRTSRLWLGVSLTGTGDFRPFKKRGKKT